MLNNPFCYTPAPSIVKAAQALAARIDATPSLRALFSEGKMLGVLEVKASGTAAERFLYAFSGLAGGSAFVEGFVPPIFAWKPEDIVASSPEHSRELQDWLFEQYVVVNGRGERRSIRQIFADQGLVPPGGTGDCAAPKLLQYALTHELKPVAIGEFWYGASPVREVRRAGAFYPACTGKCGPLLRYMLQGVDVEPNPLESDAHWQLGKPVVRYEDNALVVAEKPAGMLSVPGRPAPDLAPRQSLQDWLSDYCGSPVLACHRLDMDTSGLMVFAKTPEAQAALQQQFEKREVSKAYLARVSGSRRLPAGSRGKIALPLAPDWLDRPRQQVDPENGKPAVTDYEILETGDTGEMLVRLIPYTGRTHQLRIHCAHPDGLDSPIVGDRLYGGKPAERLMLHAAHLSFRHPADGHRMTFESPMEGTRTAAPHTALLDALDWGTQKAVVIGHKTPDTDSVCSAIAYAALMNALGYPCEPKIAGPLNRETRFLAERWNLPVPALLNHVEPGTRLILVDHAEYAQAVDGAPEARILQVIDHHGVGDITEPNIVLYKAWPVGSTCTVVYDSFREYGIDIPDEIARVLLAGLISDTRNLKEHTTTTLDTAMWKALTARLGLSERDVAELFAGMEQAERDRSGLTDLEIFLSSFKDYRIGGIQLGIGSLLIDPEPAPDAFLDRMLAVMPEVRQQRGKAMVFAKIDVGDGTFILYEGAGAKALAESAFGPSLREGICHSETILSRKIDVVPMLTAAMKRNGLA